MSENHIQSLAKKKKLLHLLILRGGGVSMSSCVPATCAPVSELIGTEESRYNLIILREKNGWAVLRTFRRPCSVHRWSLRLFLKRRRNQFPNYHFPESSKGVSWSTVQDLTVL